MKKAFTLAEILITLTVIGIVAVIALPSITLSVQEKAFDSQRKALHSRLSQAIAQIDNLANFGEYTETKDEENNKIVTDNAAETFVTKALSKVYKVKSTCDVNHLSDCGIAPDFLGHNQTTFAMPKKLGELSGANPNYYGMSGAKDSPGGGWQDNVNAAAIETGNGESILVFYNPYCGGNANVSEVVPRYKMCVSFLYDLNGQKGPNEIGKDLGFVTAFYNTDPVVVAPMPLEKSAGSAPSYSDDDNNAAGLCKKQDENSRLPDKEEMLAMAISGGFFGVDRDNMWSGTVDSSGANGYAWGRRNGWNAALTRRDTVIRVHCIKK